MTDAPTSRDPLPRIGQRSGADPFPARTADPALEAVHNAVRRRLPEIMSAGVPEAAGLDMLLKRDREELVSTATVFLTRSAHDREAASAALAASAAALRDRLALTTADGSVQRFLVDTADGIFTSGGGRTVSVDVDGYLVLDGSAVTLCDGGWIAFNSTTMDLVPTMALFDLSTTPPTELPAQDGDSTVALHLSCETSGFIEPGGIDGRDIFRGYDLQHTGAVVPAGGQLRVQLSLVFSFSIVGDGEVQASFATTPRRVLTPGVLFVATDM